MNKTVKDLEVVDGKTLLSMEIEPPKFIISRIFATGLHLLAGSPKIGKIMAFAMAVQSSVKGVAGMGV